MKGKQTLLLACAASLLICEAEAGDSEGGEAGAFLRRGVGSRALAMGSAYTSLAADASAIYWNPAGLTEIKNREFLGMFSVLTLDRQEIFVSIANNFSNNFSLGVGWLKFGVNNIDGRDQNGNITETFDDSENSFMLSMGQKFGFFSLGMTGKYIHHALYDRSGNGFSVDFGLTAAVTEMVRIGIVVQDVGAQLKWNTESKLKEDIPAYVHVGASFQPDFLPVVFAVEAAKLGSGGGISFRTGGEYCPVEFFGIRAGYDGQNPTFGGLARIPSELLSTQFEYAATRDVLQNEFVHHITLRLGF
jgi:hypothetical protein